MYPLGYISVESGQTSATYTCMPLSVGFVWNQKKATLVWNRQNQNGRELASSPQIVVKGQLLWLGLQPSPASWSRMKDNPKACSRLFPRVLLQDWAPLAHRGGWLNYTLLIGSVFCLYHFLLNVPAFSFTSLMNYLYLNLCLGVFLWEHLN